MALVSSLFRANAPDPDDKWYRPIGGGVSLTGLRIDPEIAMKLSAVWRCVQLISESIATLPFVVYRRRGDDGKERAADHPLFDVLHDQPNATQTALEFRQQLTVHALLRGNAYARKVPGPRGFADQLVPLHPDRVTPSRRAGRPYKYVGEDGREEWINAEDVFRIRGLSLDGVTGISVIEYARESLGIGLAAEQYAGRVFSQDGRPRGVLEHPGNLSTPAAGRLADTWQQTYSGLGNAHKVAVLEEGMKFTPLSVTPDDAQMLASREFSVEDIARWFGVPPHMIGSTAKVTSWGSGIEQLSTGFVVFTLLPWMTRWEQAVSRDLILNRRAYFAEHVVDGLVRGDIKTRYECYAIGRQNGWLSANDVRRLENMNPVPGGDRYLEPLNMQPAGQSNGASAETLDYRTAIQALAEERTDDAE